MINIIVVFVVTNFGQKLDKTKEDRLRHRFVVVLLNGLATLTESELKTGLKLTEPEKFLLNLD